MNIRRTNWHINKEELETHSTKIQSVTGMLLNNFHTWDRPLIRVCCYVPEFNNYVHV